MEGGEIILKNHKISEVSNSDTRQLTFDQQQAIKKLESIGYISSSRIVQNKSGVTIYNKQLAYKGLNLYISGHSPVAILIDMEGKELHRWHCDFESVWPNYEKGLSENHKFFRRAHLFRNGDILAIFEGIGIVKLDKDSNILFVYKQKPHHDLYVTDEGNIYVLTRKAVIDPEYNKTKPILEDFITILDPNGTEIKQVSILKCLERSYPEITERLEREGDILHTNTIELLDDKLYYLSPAFKPGNVLIATLCAKIVCVIDLELEKAVWVLPHTTGLWHKPHQPTVLENGHMLIFDNGVHTYRSSRVLEFDPFSKEIFWSYKGTKQDPFYSGSCGSCAQLPNGNILISETQAGKVFEVTKENTKVWEFINLYKSDKNDGTVGVICELIRYDFDYCSSWLSYTKK